MYVVNANKPYFTSSEIVKDESYIKYGPLDSIKRVTSAMACIRL